MIRALAVAHATAAAAVSVFYLDSMWGRRYSSPGECPRFSSTPNKKQSNEASLRAVTTTLLYKG